MVRPRTCWFRDEGVIYMYVFGTDVPGPSMVTGDLVGVRSARDES
jgi:hypothetical protein